MGYDKNSLFRKCGEIWFNTKPNKKTKAYVFNCAFCNTNCDQLKKFSLHLDEKHSQQLLDEPLPMSPQCIDKDENKCEEGIKENLDMSVPEIKVEELMDLETATSVSKDIKMEPLSNSSPLERPNEDPLETSAIPTRRSMRNKSMKTGVTAEHVEKEPDSEDGDPDDVNSNDMDYEDSVDGSSSECGDDNTVEENILNSRKLSHLSEISSDDARDPDFNATTNDSGRTDVSHNSFSTFNNYTIKENIINAKFKIVNKRGRSKVWEVFGKVTDETGKEISKIVACRKCSNVYKFDERSTSNLVKHRCYLMTTSIATKILLDDDSKTTAVDVFTKWSVENCRPFKISADSGFRNVAEFLIEIGSKYGPNVDIESLLPHPTTISRNIESLYTKHFGELKSEIVSVKDSGFGLTTDLWNDNYLRKSFMSITIHFIKEGQLLTRLLGFISIDDEKCTHTTIRNTVDDLLSEYDCTLNDKVIIVTDRGANMIEAFQDCNNIHCVSHLIRNTVEKSIHGVSEISVLCELCTKLVRYFKKSGANNSLKTTLKSFSPTRWDILTSIEKNWSDIIKVLQEKGELHRIDGINLQAVSALAEVLQHFEKASSLLEGEQYPTMDIAFAHIHLLKKKSVSKDNDAGVIKQFKGTLAMNIQNVVVENLKIFHKVGLYLYPPANKLIYFHENEKQEIINECKRQMKIYDENFCGQGSQSPPHNVKSSVNLEALEDFVDQSNIFESTDRVSDEIRLYSSLNVVLNDDFNVLQWWDLHKNEFPLLYKINKVRVKTHKKISKKQDLQEKEITKAILKALENQPVLWDIKLRSNVKEIRQKGFRAVAEEVGENFQLQIKWEDVRSRIRHIRNEYTNEYKKQLKGEKCKMPWYSEHIKFLEENIKALSKNRDRMKKYYGGWKRLDDSHTSILIDYYKNYEVLWQVNDIGFLVKSKRREAIKLIMEDLKVKHRIYVNVNGLQRRLDNINNLYSADKELQLKCEMNRSIFVPSSEFYGKLSFLGESQGPFKCPHCNEIISNYENYHLHVAGHTESLPFKCSLCEKRFNKLYKYIVHAKYHLGMKNFNCDVCGKILPYRSKLALHMREHTGIDPYLCEICGASFKQRASYDNHILRHEKRFRFECQICKAGFNHKDVLKTHVKVHLNIRDILCKVCGKGFTAKRYLYRHQLIHSDTKRYKCDVCGKAFAQDTGLRAHRKQHIEYRSLAGEARKTAFRKGYYKYNE